MTACTLYKSQRGSSSLSRLTKKSNMSTLWRRKEFLRVRSKKELAEKAQDMEVTILVKKSQEAWYNLDPGSFFVKSFLGQATGWGRNQ